MDASRIVHVLQQMPDAFAANWINEVRRDFGKRLQNESAVAELGMGNRQTGCFQNPVTIKNDVDVESTRLFRAFSFSKVFLFDDQTDFE